MIDGLLNVKSNVKSHDLYCECQLCQKEYQKLERKSYIDFLRKSYHICNGVGKMFCPYCNRNALSG
jgi:hypothetical protein